MNSEEEKIEEKEKEEKEKGIKEEVAELLPIVSVDYARPRPMSPAEAEDVLRTVFNASGW